MQPSPLTIGIVMIGVAVMAPAMAVNGGASPTALSTFAALPLAVGGVAMLVRRRWSFWVAMTGGAVTALAGGLGLLLGHAVGLPIKPVVVVVIGLYCCFRIAIARRGLTPRAPRRMIADELADKREAPKP